MRTGKFFYFTIKGNGFDPLFLAKAVELPCDVFFKDEISTHDLLKKEIKQKSTRWIYKDIDQSETKIGGFLTKNLKIIVKKLSILSEYIEDKDNEAKIELVVYSENKTDLVLNKSQIRLINKIGVGISISFC